MTAAFDRIQTITCMCIFAVFKFLLIVGFMYTWYAHKFHSVNFLVINSVNCVVCYHDLFEQCGFFFLGF